MATSTPPLDGFEVDEPRPAPLQKRKQLEDTEMDITPMIDITFLLLIFFLVASKMDQSTAVQLPPAKTGRAVPMRNSVVLTVAPGATDGPAMVYKGDGASDATALDSSDPDALVLAITEFVEAEVAADPNKTWVLIKGAKGTKHRDVSRVAKAAAEVASIQNMAVGVMQEN